MVRIVQVTITKTLEGQFKATCLEPLLTVEGRTVAEVKQKLMEELRQILKDEDPYIIKGNFYAEELEN